MYNLVGHPEMRTALDYLLRTDTAILLFRCLKVAGFFNMQPPESGMYVCVYTQLPKDTLFNIITEVLLILALIHIKEIY